MKKFAAKWLPTLTAQPLTIPLDAKKTGKYHPLAFLACLDW
ncbi:MAG TPA: hypothetical protein VKE98_13305 [Gemmataceae bacterium]|nr:hypothetical protein [Gemmataceae bacterium]